MNATTGFVIIAVSMMALVGFLCWTLQSGWPCLLMVLLAGGTKERKRKRDEGPRS